MLRSELFDSGFWPLWVGAGLLMFAGLTTCVTGKIPNSISLWTLLLGLTVALLASLDVEPAGGVAGGIGSSLLTVLVAAFLLIPLWSFAGDWIPGGTVKMQIAFAAWVGSVFPVARSLAMLLGATLFGVVVSTVVTAVTLKLAAPRSPDDDRPRRSIPIQLFVAAGTVAGLLILTWIFPTRSM